MKKVLQILSLLLFNVWQVLAQTMQPSTVSSSYYPMGLPEICANSQLTLGYEDLTARPDSLSIQTSTGQRKYGMGNSSSFPVEIDQSSCASGMGYYCGEVNVRLNQIPDAISGTIFVYDSLGTILFGYTVIVLKPVVDISIEDTVCSNDSPPVFTSPASYSLSSVLAYNAAFSSPITGAIVSPTDQNATHGLNCEAIVSGGTNLANTHLVYNHYPFFSNSTFSCPVPISDTVTTTVLNNTLNSVSFADVATSQTTAVAMRNIMRADPPILAQGAGVSFQFIPMGDSIRPDSTPPGIYPVTLVFSNGGCSVNFDTTFRVINIPLSGLQGTVLCRGSAPNVLCRVATMPFLYYPEVCFNQFSTCITRWRNILEVTTVPAGLPGLSGPSSDPMQGNNCYTLDPSMVQDSFITLRVRYYYKDSTVSTFPNLLPPPTTISIPTVGVDTVMDVEITIYIVDAPTDLDVTVPDGVYCYGDTLDYPMSTYILPLGAYSVQRPGVAPFVLPGGGIFNPDVVRQNIINPVTEDSTTDISGEIVYVYPQGTGCDTTLRFPFILLGQYSPVITLLTGNPTDTSFCADEPLVPLGSSTLLPPNTVAEWSSPGSQCLDSIGGSLYFNPANANIGANEIRLTFNNTIDQTKPCPRIGSRIFNVFGLSSFSLQNIPGTICQNQGNILASFSQPGAFWDGTGASLNVTVGLDMTIEPDDINMGANDVLPITYKAKYIDMNGCEVVDSTVATVYRVGTTTIIGLDTQYCIDADVDIAIPITVPSQLTSGNVVFSGGGMIGGTVFSPEAAGAGAHTITAINYHGTCKDTATWLLQVDSLPEPYFTNALACCLGDSLLLEASPLGGSFIGNNISGALFEPESEGNYYVLYTVTDNNNCTGSQSTQIAAYNKPEIRNFKFHDGNICKGEAGRASALIGGLSYFLNGSPFDSITSINAYFDGMLADFDIYGDSIVIHISDTTTTNSGIFDLMLEIENRYLCTQRDTLQIVVSPLVTYPYTISQDFSAQWYSDQTVWLPNATAIDINENVLAQQSNFFFSAVYSPCVAGIDTATRPMVEVVYTSDMLETNGGRLEYYDYGSSQWQAVGEPNRGRNWYTDDAVMAFLQQQQYAWTGEEEDAVSARFAMDSYLPPLGKKLKTRLRYGSVLRNTIQEDDCQITKFSLRPRNKTSRVLLATNIGDDNQISIDSFRQHRNELAQKIGIYIEKGDLVLNTFAMGAPSDGDPFYNANPALSNAEELLLGLISVDEAFLNNIAVPFDFSIADIEQLILDDPEFVLELSNYNINLSGGISAQLKITALKEMPNKRYFFKCYLVENENHYNNNPNLPVHFLVRQNLPSQSEDIFIEKSWIAGEDTVISIIGQKDNWAVSNGNAPCLTATMTDSDGNKNVFAAVMDDDCIVPPNIIVGTSPSAENHSESIVWTVFPNPSNGNFSVEFSDAFNSNPQFRLHNTLGVEIPLQLYSQNGQLFMFDTLNLPSGTYFLSILLGNQIKTALLQIIR